MRVLLLLFTCFSLFAQSAESEFFSSPLDITTADSSELAAMAASISNVGELHAHFSQQKTVRSLSKPLVSSGDFHFYSDSLLIWSQRIPFEEIITIDPKGNITISDDLGSVSEIASEENRMNSLFSSLLSGDFEPVDKLFEIYMKKESEQWILGLVPRRAAMKKGLTSIVVSCKFDGFISDVKLSSPHGETSIAFTISETR